MKICLDYQAAVQQMAGVGRYTRVLASYMPKMLSDVDSLKLFYFDFKRDVKSLGIDGAREQVSRLIPGRVMQKLWNTIPFPPFEWFAGDADIYHFPNFLLKPVYGKGKKVVSIHDMSFFRYPEFTERKNLRNLKKGIKNTVEKADAIITISKFSADEILHFFPNAEGKVFYSHLGIADGFHRESEDKIAEVKKKYGLERPFLLTVGTIEPRKNHLYLMDLLDKLMVDDIDLVVVGGQGWNSDNIFARFNEEKYSRNFHYLNHLADGDLTSLYSAASLFIMPSFYEGFGFPIVEAMACGTPVICSQGGSLKEVAKDGAIVMEDYDVDAWCDKIRNVISESSVVTALVERGYAVASSYKWENTVSQTLDIYRKIL